MQLQSYLDSACHVQGTDATQSRAEVVQVARNEVWDRDVVSFNVIDVVIAMKGEEHVDDGLVALIVLQLEHQTKDWSQAVHLG